MVIVNSNQNIDPLLVIRTQPFLGKFLNTPFTVIKISFQTHYVSGIKIYFSISL